MHFCQPQLDKLQERLRISVENQGWPRCSIPEFRSPVLQEDSFNDVGAN